MEKNNIWLTRNNKRLNSYTIWFIKPVWEKETKMFVPQHFGRCCASFDMSVYFADMETTEQNEALVGLEPGQIKEFHNKNERQ